MDQQEVWRDFLALSDEDQRWIARLIAALHNGTRRSKSDDPETLGDLADEPFIGMWRDRADMEDSGAWVRAMREREWGESHG